MRHTQCATLARLRLALAVYGGVALLTAVGAAFALRCGAADAPWDDASCAFVVLREDAPGDARAFADALESVGGHASVVWPPRVAVVYATDAVLAAPPLRRWIARVQRAPAGASGSAGAAPANVAMASAALANGAIAVAMEPQTALATRAWSLAVQWRASGVFPAAPSTTQADATASAAPHPPVPDDGGRPPFPDAGPLPVALGPSPPRAQGKTSARLPYGAQYYDTSEFFMGTSAVGVWLLEAAGSQYDWTQQEKDQTLAGVMASLDNWVRKGGPAAALTFVVDVHTDVPVSGVPIQHPQSWDKTWMDEVLTAAGFSGANGFEKGFAYNNSIRDAFNTNWCFSIVIVDSDPAVNQGLFSGGGYAWAYYGGPWVYMARYSTWAYNWQRYYGVVPMHEIGHIFFATDEYEGIQQWSGYLSAPDNASSSVVCLMNQNDSTAVCTSSRRQIGWRDTDGDGILDILDTEPLVTLNPLVPDPTSDATPTWTGQAHVATLPNANPNSHYAPAPHGMTLVTIADVQCRIVNWPWLSATPDDGAFGGYDEAFTWTAPPLPDGVYTLEARALTSAGNWLSVPAIDAFRVAGSPVAVGGTLAPSTSPVLEPLQPNPTNGWGLVRFVLPRDQTAQVAVYDAAGRRVRMLGDGPFAAGQSQLLWDGRDDAGRRLPAGVYVCRLRTAQGNRSQKLLLLH